MQLTTPSPSPSAPRKTAGDGWLEQHGDVRVVHLAGDFKEMGRQHGALLAEDVRRGPIPYYEEMVERLISRAALGKATPYLWPRIQKVLGSRVEAAFPDFAKETIAGLALGAGIDEEEMMAGCTMPDSLVWLVGQMMRYGGRGPAVAHRVGLELGCTSAVAWGKSTKDGKLYHARNFDYHGVHAWPETKTLLFHEPKQGQRYVSVTAAGVALGGITAMNEAGLTIAVHQHMFSNGARFGGTPVGIVGDIVMREAKTLDDAKRILDAHKSIGCWTYNIASAHEKAVLCYEENPSRKTHRIYSEASGEGTFGYANVYLDAELGATEVAGYDSYWRHNEGRHRRCEELLARGDGNHDAQSLADILGDIGDPSCRIRDSIAMVMTVGSVVFRPEDGTLWMGTGVAPTSHGTFKAFDLFSADHRSAAKPIEVDAPDGGEAFELYRQAYIAYVDDTDLAKAEKHLDECIELAPEQTLYRSLAGLLALEGNNANRAIKRLDEAIAQGHVDRERVASFYLWRGRAKDLLGKRSDAQADYRRCLGHFPDPPVRKAARKGLRRAYNEAARRKLQVDMSLADVVGP